MKTSAPYIPEQILQPKNTQNNMPTVRSVTQYKYPTQSVMAMKSCRIISLPFQKHTSTKVYTANIIVSSLNSYKTNHVYKILCFILTAQI